jgi:ribosome assembly protein YihI (activator of Der GTPase)
MSRKLDRVRIKNMLDALEHVELAAERLAKADDQYLQEVSQRISDFVLEEMQELGMMLQNDDETM